MKKIFLTSILFFNSFLAFSKAKKVDSKNVDVASFIIDESPKKTHGSKNAIKEELAISIQTIFDESAFICAIVGDLLRLAGEKVNKLNKDKQPLDSFDCLQKFASISKVAGEQLHELGALQQCCSKKAAQLIENKKPFKGAGRNVLGGALSATNGSLKKLKENSKNLGDLKVKVAQKMSPNKLLSLIENNFNQELCKISGIRAELMQDKCFQG